MKKIYLGCDLFTEGQRWQANEIQKELERRCNVEIYNPAENLEINDKSAGFSSGYDILLADYERLKNSDLLIALMDTGDLGLAAEMGIAFERGIPIFQLHTDIRLGGNDKKDKIEELEKDIFQNDFLYINKLLTGLSYVNKEGKLLDKARIYKSKEDLIDDVEKYLKK
mgnify:CR=1 FL=1